MYKLTIYLCVLMLFSCSGKGDKPKDVVTAALRTGNQPDAAELLVSTSKGTPEKGSLENGNLLPREGSNFFYFDTLSYRMGRAYVNDKVLKTIVKSYEAMDKLAPGRTFRVMEASLKKGGRIFGHFTHQNGMSVDFMMPLNRDGKAYYKLDTLGALHYFLSFDKQGRYLQDKKVVIDFNTVALHILELDKAAREQGLKVKKVIINTNLKDELFASGNGKKLKHSGIYVVQNLTLFVNAFHDDHYHIDFEPLNP